MRPNVPWPGGGVVRFVGGVPDRASHTMVNLERVYEGERRGEPFFSEGVVWVRVNVPGLSDDMLVPVENLRP